MAKLEKRLCGDFDELLSRIETGILNGSLSATLEESSDCQNGTARCSVRVFERFSLNDGNRVAMTVTLFQNGEEIHLIAITAGGGRAVFKEFGTLGEKKFLEKLVELL